MDGFVIMKPHEFENELCKLFRLDHLIMYAYVFICSSSYFKYLLFYFWMET